jgi:hypothetical protein
MNALAPAPWTISLVKSQWRPHWRNSVSVMDAEHGEICVLTHGYEIDGKGNSCPSWQNACLIAAAPDLLACQIMGMEKLTTPDFLDWIADRMVGIYGESPNADYVHSLRERAKAGRAAIAKATGH